MKQFLSLFILFILFIPTYLSAQEATPDSLEVVIEGSVSVFRHKKSHKRYLKKGDEFYFLPPETQTMTRAGLLKERPYRRILLKHLNECPSIYPSIKSISLNDNDLIRLLKKYYECIGETNTYTESKSERREFMLGAFMGAQNTKMNVTGNTQMVDGAKYEKHISFMGGFLAEINGRKTKIGFGVQVGFTKYDLHGKTHYSTGPGNMTNYLNSSYSQMQIRAYLKKYFTTTPFDIQLKIGPSINFNSNFKQSHTQIERLTTTNSTLRSRLGPHFIERNSSFGVHGAIGLRRNLKNNLSLGFDIRVEALNVMNQNNQEGRVFKQTFITPQLELGYKIR